MTTNKMEPRKRHESPHFLETNLDHAAGLARAFFAEGPHTEEGLAMMVKQRLWRMGGRKKRLDPVSYQAARTVFEALAIPTLTASEAPPAAWGWAVKRATAEHC